MATERTILHADMDAFFAAIAQLDNPELRGRPVLTGGDGPRGVVSTASYEARPFGCRSAMPMAVAKRLCPHAVVAHVPGARIREMSDRLFAILDRFSPIVQPVSVDEAFIDLTGAERLIGDGPTAARALRRQVHAELGLTASVGVSHNKFLAKLASDMDKPDGLTVLDRRAVDTVLPALGIDRLWGVGPATRQRLEDAGLRRVADLRAAGEPALVARLGELGAHLHRLAWGLDDRPVVPDRCAKSIGQEQTFDHDLAEPDAVRAVLLTHAEQVGRRLRKHRTAARTVTVKTRFGDFQTITRAATLDAPTDLTDDLYHAGRSLFDAWARTAFRPVRLIGLTASGLTDTHQQLGLFPDPDRDRRRQLDQTLDRIHDRFGKGAVHRGAGPDPDSPEPHRGPGDDPLMRRS